MPLTVNAGLHTFCSPRKDKHKVRRGQLMIFPEAKDWEDWAITSENHKFFTLRWHEVFDENTLDTWQVRFSNIKSILVELKDSIDIVRVEHRYHHNIECLLIEAREISKNDILVEEHYKFISEHLAVLENIYNEKLKKESGKGVDEFERALKFIISNLSGYHTRLFESLKKLLSQVSEDYKKNMYSLINSLATELIDLGYSIHSLRDSFDILTDSSIGGFVDRFARIEKNFSGVSKKYTSLFRINWPRETLELPSSDVKLSIGPLQYQSPEIVNFVQKDPQAVIASVEVIAHDYYSARYYAETKLDKLFSVGKIFCISKNISLRNEASLVIDENEKSKLTEKDISRLGYIKDSKKPIVGIEAYYKLIKNIDHHSKGQIGSALQYHKQALHASTDEIRLINMWIALESLARDKNKPIIESICSTIPCNIASNYLYRIIKSLPIDMKDVLKTEKGKELISLLSLNPTQHLMPKQMLKILLDIKDGDLINKLYEVVAGNTLMCFRISSLRHWISSGPKSVVKRIELHRQHVEWQLKRIYRARNRIIHQGAYYRGLRQLVQHLHSYLVITIHNLVHDLLKNNTFSISDALVSRKLAFEYFVKKLQNKKIFSVKQLLQIDSALYESTEDLAWRDSANEETSQR